MPNQKSAASIAEELGRTGLSVYPGFLSPKALSAARDDFDLTESEGLFHRAGTGQGDGHEVRDDVRRDQIHWLNRDVEKTVQSSLLARFDVLQVALNRTLFLGLSDFECHYASYPEGGFYQRHRDSFDDAAKLGPSRIVSLVLYLNENWKPRDGGKLRVYGAGNSHTDVSPIGGTLVCFMSRETEHEVLLSSASRMSLTGWFRRPTEI